MDKEPKPVSPGEILLDQFLKPLGISQTKLAIVIGVPPRRINEIVHGKRRISADTAIRFGIYFGTSPQFWLGLQTDYDLDIAKRMTSGVDLWLNTPQPPLEASGTSGMKAALNGIPSLSVLDGWWIEGLIEGVTGWSIGERSSGAPMAVDRTLDALSLYQKMEHVVLPMFYGNRDHFIDIMRHAIALNGSFFNTQRMLQQYVLRAYY